MKGKDIMIIFGSAPEKIERGYSGMFAVGAPGNMPPAPGGGMDGPPPPMGGMDGPPPPMGGPNAAPKKPSFPTVTVKDGDVQKPDGLDGTFTPDCGSDVKLEVLDDGYTGGIYVDGAGYTLQNSKINLDGNGISLGGPGSGACVDNGGELIIKNCHIETTGSARCATSAENGSTLKVYDSTLISHGAPFGSELPPGAFMATPPEALEIDGNCRTHVTMGGSFSYFYNSTISADGWAALSTDISNGWVYLEANDCVVKTVNSGYGAYADGGCHDVLNRCKVDVASMAVIAAGECDVKFNDCQCNCGTYFLLSHCIGQPVEVTEVDVCGGSINCVSPMAILKSCNIRFDLDGVDIKTDSGILIKSVINDDPKADDAANPKEPVYGMRVTFANMEAKGDIIHGDYKARPMYVTLKNAKLSGAVSQAYLAMDDESSWYAAADSVVGIDGKWNVSKIDAPAGVVISVINGDKAAEYTLASGGKLVVQAK